MFSVVKTEAVAVEADLLCITVPEGLESDTLAALSEATGVDIEELAAEEHFEGETGKTFLLRGASGLGAPRVALAGVGADPNGAVYRVAGVSLARIARDARCKKVAIVCDTDPALVAELVGGFELGSYRFDRHVSKDDDFFDGLESVDIVCPADECGIEGLLEEPRIIAAAVNRARDLVNESPNLLVPETLAQAARDIASLVNLEAKIFDESELHANGFNLIMAVGKGSEHPPRLVHLIYRPEGEVTRKIAFVGKGVTFDTGGYNLKPGSSLLNMHCDMAGAAAVLGAAHAIGRLRPPGVEIHFVVPTAENAIANNSFKPQDIFRGYGGKTVEIHNTDAEGRLLLADALAYTQEQGVATIVDLATLTGACVVALGEGTAGLFSDDDELANALLTASAATGESYWRMPLTEDLDKKLDTPHADMKNVGPRWGGAITAALFLKRWVEIDGWAHLDIAGPAWADEDTDLSPKGGTGFGVSTLVEYVRNLAG